MPITLIYAIYSLIIIEDFLYKDSIIHHHRWCCECHLQLNVLQYYITPPSVCLYDSSSKQVLIIITGQDHQSFCYLLQLCKPIYVYLKQHAKDFFVKLRFVCETKRIEMTNGWCKLSVLIRVLYAHNRKCIIIWRIDRILFH